MDNAGWAIIIGAIGAGGYYLYRETRPTPLSPEELDLIQPAPFSDQGEDQLSPLDLEQYREAIGLSGGGFTLDPRHEFPGIWQYEQHDNPNNWNTPNHPGGPKEPEPTTGNMKGVLMTRIGTANIRNYPDMERGKVAADARRMGQLTTIWGGQEIQGGEDTGTVLQALGNNWGIVMPRSSNPIFYRKDRWEAFDDHYLHYDRSDTKLTPKHNGALSVAFRSKLRPNLEPFAVANTHLIVGAFNRRATLELRRKRRPLWQHEFDLYQQTIRYQLRKGRSVFFLGDYNHPSCPIPIRGGRWISNNGLDKIGFIAAKGGVRIKGFKGNPHGEIHGLNSDHSARVIAPRLRS